MKIASDGEVTSKIVKVAVVTAETQAFKRLSESEVERYLK